jgi:hypothetical protein
MAVGLGEKASTKQLRFSIDACPMRQIPTKSNSKVARDCGFALYAERNLIKRFFQFIKQFQGIAIRHEKLRAISSPAPFNLRAGSAQMRTPWLAAVLCPCPPQELRGEESIAQLCRHEGIASSMYCGGSKEFLEAGVKCGLPGLSGKISLGKRCNSLTAPIPRSRAPLSARKMTAR